MKDIDLWDLNISASEYIRMAREAKGPEHLHAIFIEAKAALGDVEYGFFSTDEMMILFGHFYPN